jgi:hypothetical protein
VCSFLPVYVFGLFRGGDADIIDQFGSDASNAIAQAELTSIQAALSQGELHADSG